jgi:N-acetyltransferase 10
MEGSRTTITPVYFSNYLVSISNVDDVYRNFSPFDLKRLESYSHSLLDYHVIIDLVPSLSLLYFMDMFSGCEGVDALKLSPVQAAILISIGLFF